IAAARTGGGERDGERRDGPAARGRVEGRRRVPGPPGERPVARAARGAAHTAQVGRERLQRPLRRVQRPFLPAHVLPSHRQQCQLALSLGSATTAFVDHSRWGEHPMADSATAQAVVVRRGQRRAVVASTVGTTIEWYDFFLYGTASALIFPALFLPK